MYKPSRYHPSEKQFQEICQLERSSLFQSIGTSRYPGRVLCFTEEQLPEWQKIREMVKSRFQLFVSHTQQQVYNSLQQAIEEKAGQEGLGQVEQDRLLYEARQVLSAEWFSRVLKAHGSYRGEKVRNHDTQYIKVEWKGKEVVYLSRPHLLSLGKAQSAEQLGESLELVQQALQRSGLFVTEVKMQDRGLGCWPFCKSSKQEKPYLFATQTQLPEITEYPEGIEPL